MIHFHYINAFATVGVNNRLEVINMFESLRRGIKVIAGEINPMLDTYRESSISSSRPSGIALPFVCFEDRNIFKNYDNMGRVVEFPGHGGCFATPSVPRGLFRVGSHQNLTYVASENRIRTYHQGHGFQQSVGFNIKRLDALGRIIEYVNYNPHGIVIEERVLHGVADHSRRAWVISRSLNKISKIRFRYSGLTHELWARPENFTSDSVIFRSGEHTAQLFPPEMDEAMVNGEINLVNVFNQRRRIVSVRRAGHPPHTQTITVSPPWSPMPTSGVIVAAVSSDSGLVEEEVEVREPETGALLTPISLTIISGILWVGCTNGIMYEVGLRDEYDVSTAISASEGLKIAYEHDHKPHLRTV